METPDFNNAERKSEHPIPFSANRSGPAHAEPTGAPPGTLLHYERLNPELWPEGAERAFRMEYQGVDYRGGLRPVCGSVFVPPHDGAGTHPVLGWAHCTVGLNSRCAPSEVGLIPEERAHLTGWLREGFVVAATDYEGLGNPEPHPYLNGEAIADDIVDSVRAAHQLGLPVDDRTVVAGFSQGGHGALYTAVMLTSYAPELDFRGTVALAPPVRLIDFIRQVTGRGEDPVHSLMPTVLAGLRVSHPDFDFTGILTDAGMRLLELALTDTLGEVDRVAGTMTNDSAGFTDIAERPEIRVLLGYAEPPTTLYDRPLFVGAGEIDPILTGARGRSFAAAMTLAGNTVDFHEYPGMGHTDLLAPAAAEAARWGRALVEGPRIEREPVTAGSRREARFRILDATGDGQIAADDFEALALRITQRLGGSPGSPAAQRVRKGYRDLWGVLREHFDTDHDGTVSLEEFLEGRSSLDPAAVATIDELTTALIAMVTDGADVVGRTDFRRMLGGCGLTDAEADLIFDELDADHNRVLDAEEIARAVREFCFGGGADSTGYWLFGQHKAGAR